MDFQLRNKVPKRRVKAKLRDDRKDPVQINATWAMDFVYDQLATSSKIRILTIVDTFSRLSTVIDPKLNYRGEDVVQTLELVCKNSVGKNGLASKTMKALIGRKLSSQFMIVFAWINKLYFICP